MKKNTRWLLGGLALAGAGLGAIGAVLVNKNSKPKRRRRDGGTSPADTWARPGMKVTFRAELMPGRDGSERTFRITDLLPSGRVVLDGVSGEHAEKEFEAVRRDRLAPGYHS
jgi:hypothetical protein